MRKSISMVVSLFWIVCAGYPTRSNVGANHIYYGSHEEQQSYTASDYVQDGLVCLMDGIENVGLGEHDDEASSWINLVNGGLSEDIGSRTWDADGINTSGHLSLSWGSPTVVSVMDDEPNSRTMEVVFSTKESSA